MTGFQAERLDDCYLADISVFDLICIDFHSLTIHGTGIFTFSFIIFAPLKTIKCK